MGEKYRSLHVLGWWYESSLKGMLDKGYIPIFT